MSMVTTTNSQKNPEMRNWKRRILISALALVIIVILLRVIDSQKQFNRAICYEKRNMEAASFYLKVTGKYNDSLNHNFNTIRYLDLKKMMEKKMYIVNETGGFYNSIQIGDTLFKNNGDLKVSNSNRDTTYLLIYNCIENYNKR